MQLNYIINDIERQITESKTELVFLEEKKQALLKLVNQFPDAHYEKNNICVDNLWEKMTCMRIFWGYGYGYTSKINIRFSVGKKDMVGNVRLHSYPLNNPIANISILPSIYKGGQRIREITVLDYSVIIPMECPKRKDFMKRIRNYILNLIVKKNMALNNKSYNVDEFHRLILL